jgi:hypothetical protein
MLCELEVDETVSISLCPSSAIGSEGYDCITMNFRLGLSFADL